MFRIRVQMQEGGLEWHAKTLMLWLEGSGETFNVFA